MSENIIHAHIETASRDCDGLYTSGHMMTLNDSERAEAQQDVNDFSAIRFTDRVVASVVNAYSLMSEGTLKVTRLADGDVRLSWSEPTEEGYRSVEATICTDPCEDSEPWARDHTAEAEGY
jgi:hypothetical protein